MACKITSSISFLKTKPPESSSWDGLRLGRGMSGVPAADDLAAGDAEGGLELWAELTQARVSKHTKNCDAPAKRLAASSLHPLQCLRTASDEVLGDQGCSNFTYKRDERLGDGWQPALHLRSVDKDTDFAEFYRALQRDRCIPNGRARFERPFGLDVLPVGEVQFVEPDRVGRLLVVSVLLIVDGHAIPRGRRGILVVVESRSHSVECDRLEQELIVRGALDLKNEMVPGICHRIAGNASRMPLLAGIVPDVPLVAPSDPAFMSPNVGVAVNELVDIELQRLRDAEIFDVKIDIVGEVVEVGDDRMVGVGHALRGEVPDQVVVPEDIGVVGLPANVMSVAFPLSDGDEISWVIDQVACGPEGVQEVQIL